jgi:hypothetical protein
MTSPQMQCSKIYMFSDSYSVTVREVLHVESKVSAVWGGGGGVALHDGQVLRLSSGHS